MARNRWTRSTRCTPAPRTRSRSGRSGAGYRYRAMPAVTENLAIAAASIRAHKLRAALTILGLTMGVATLITVMTIVQGANLYVEQKVANLGTDVFQLAKTPFAVVDFTAVTKALRNKNITMEQVDAVARSCRLCQRVGASVSTTINTHYHSKE